MSDIMSVIRARHSVRQYLDKPIPADLRAALDTAAKACNAESGMNIQIIYDEPRCFGGMFSKLLRFRGCNNYIALVGPADDPKLEEKAGYYGEHLVLEAQKLGLNTCWVGLSKGKGEAKIGAGERQVIVIALGYGENQGTPHRGKSPSDVCDAPADAPDWFGLGVEAALLAPTAINQQKFRITLQGDTVRITADKGPFSIVDLGIVKYHFDAVTGRKCE
ncbi:MAG: nitroreductase [Clostridia bacterium]|nr:nitroreductase [Clostridia bacterium]